MLNPYPMTEIGETPELQAIYGCAVAGPQSTRKPLKKHWFSFIRRAWPAGRDLRGARWPKGPEHSPCSRNSGKETNRKRAFEVFQIPSTLHVPWMSSQLFPQVLPSWSARSVFRELFFQPPSPAGRQAYAKETFYIFFQAQIA